MLYLVATPIGNLEDMTFRAVRVLREVHLIAAEDTRHTGRLLKHFEIDTPMTSYHDFSSERRREQLLDKLRQGDVALVSDAGMPGLSDPGYKLVAAAVEAGIPVSPIPGATAAVSALVAGGLPTDQFYFLGFPPRQTKARRQLLRDVQLLPATLVAYESPRRVGDLLTDVADILGAERPVVVARELTKLHEEFWRGTAAEGVAHFGGDAETRGEITVLIGGLPAEAAVWDEDRVRDALQTLLADGLRRKDAAGRIADLTGWRKRDVYQLSLDLDL